MLGSKAIGVVEIQKAVFTLFVGILDKGASRLVYMEIQITGGTIPSQRKTQRWATEAFVLVIVHKDGSPTIPWGISSITQRFFDG